MLLLLAGSVEPGLRPPYYPRWGAFVAPVVNFFSLRLGIGQCFAK